MFGGKMMVLNEVATQPLDKTDCFLVKFGNVYAYMPDSGQSCIILTSKVTFNIQICAQCGAIVFIEHSTFTKE